MKKVLISIFICSSFLFSIEMNAQHALQFDGNDDVVDCGMSNDFNMEGFTLECRVKFSGTSPEERPFFSVMNSGTTFDHGWWLGHSNSTDNHKAIIYIGDSLVEGLSLFSQSPINDGNWHHIAATYGYDESNTKLYLKIYVDGSLESTSPDLMALNPAIYANEPLRIGTDDWGGTFNGSLDEIRIWNRTFSDSEINDVIDSCLTGNEANLVAYYQMNEGSGSTVNDLTSNNHDGTMQNMDANSWVNSDFCGAFVGLDENTDAQSEFEFYPNPAKNFITVSTSIQNGSVKLLDQTGRTIRTQELNKGGNYVDLKGVAPGLYFVRINSKVERLIVE